MWKAQYKLDIKAPSFVAKQKKQARKYTLI